MIHWLSLLWTRPRRMSRQQWRSLAHQLGAPQVDRAHQDGLRALRRVWLRDGAK